MASWFLEPGCVTAGGYPIQYGWDEGDFIFGDYLHILRAVRVGGGADVQGNPRRVLAFGKTADKCWENLDRTIRMYDRNATITHATEEYGSA